jgi:hypothetical protein
MSEQTSMLALVAVDFLMTSPSGVTAVLSFLLISDDSRAIEKED